MGETTTIEWTDHTFSPWWGCTKIAGPGGLGSACDHCYADALAKRYGHDVWGKHAPRRLIGPAWNTPLLWDRKAAGGEPGPKTGRARHLVFCASMADVFEDHDGPMVDHRGIVVAGRSLDTERQRLFELIRATPNLVWLLLTKRPENVLRMVPERWRVAWPSNVWVGTTIEDQARADIRIPRLLQIHAPVLFVSYEPALGSVDLGLAADHSGHERDHITTDVYPQCLDCSTDDEVVDWTVPAGQRIGWVIAGGESGPGARPAHPEWFRSVRDQCATAGVPFLFKQWGEWIAYEPDAQPPFFTSQHGDMVDGHHLPAGLSEHHQVGSWWWPDPMDDTTYRRVGKKAAGRALDGVTHTGFPAEVGVNR